MGRVRINLRAWEGSMGHYVIEVGSQNRNEEPVVQATLCEILLVSMQGKEVGRIQGEDCLDTVYDVNGQEIYLTSDHIAPIAIVSPNVEVQNEMVVHLTTRFEVSSLTD